MANDIPEDAGDEAPSETNWFLLIDPSWQPESEDDSPPPEVVVGGWPVDEEGAAGPFRANPGYRPSDENSPSDPFDAVLRLAVEGGVDTTHVQLLLRDSLFDVAMNGDGRPLIVNSPDDVACVVVASSAPHRARIDSPAWDRADLGMLAELLGDDYDVLFNPGGPAAVRLTGDFLRRTLAMEEDEVAELYQRFQAVDGIDVVRWETDADEEGTSRSADGGAS
ncbi:hypothetical protein A8924_5865 [Saccharopolyspora erythraea NRRL 2338]|uniref:Type VII secretion system-associated protein n=1 Tax=Saccharopolyspora erythraea TaxID=1836 RepID=A0ABP3P497_SACER|nr:type VII secretion system-associated protein [Saccharopolyspora erythraea]EQD82667.1 hypothetical protein N599_29415 [Saccharopolyspora erythraea D]PFG98354.1 hypothetical protein A8924_5865 [Saccharopolyspora erythraea NRRL 2338]